MELNEKIISEFETKYTYEDAIESVEFDNDTQVGQFETYGEDLDTVKGVYSKTPKRVWSMIDNEDGIYLVSGFHSSSDTIYYIITKEEASSENEEYCFEN